MYLWLRVLIRVVALGSLSWRPSWEEGQNDAEFESLLASFTHASNVLILLCFSFLLCLCAFVLSQSDKLVNLCVSLGLSLRRVLVTF